VQNRFEGRIFQRTFGERVTKICSFFLEKQALRTQLFVLRVRPSTKSVYKIAQDSNCGSEALELSGNNLPRRPSNSGKLKGGSKPGKGYCILFATTSGFCNKSEKVCVDTNTRNRISRTLSEFEEYDFIVNSRKIVKSESSVFCNVDKQQNNYNGPYKIDKTLIFNQSGSNAGKATVSLSTASANSVSKGNTVLLIGDSNFQTGLSRSCYGG